MKRWKEELAGLAEFVVGIEMSGSCRKASE
jgi:hypothetical protein